MAKKSGTYAPSQVGVKTIGTRDLHPNPHNPRVLFDREPLDILKQSIAKVGILVPLTVYFDSKREHHVILDGQRRWLCARELSLPEVPVNEVAEPTLVQNIVTMFQIHKLREDWELMPTALKLELLMQELQERNGTRLAELTGLDQAVVQRCKKLLDYPKKYQDMMLDPDPGKRVKADFFIELYVVRNDRLVNSFDWFKKDSFTTAMLDRYKSGRLKAVTDFRLIKQHISNARKAGKKRQTSRRLREFTDNPDCPIDHLRIGAASAAAEAEAVRKRVERLTGELASLDLESCYGEQALWDALESLLTLIKKQLSVVGRRLQQ